MRIDGRQPDQLRDIRITPGYLRFPEGSCLIEWGANRVICAATVTPRVPGWREGSGEGWVTAEYSMLPYASKPRAIRDAVRTNPNSRALEIQRLIGRSLRAVCDLKVFGERTVTIDCDVLEADGGTRTASVTGGFVALALAMAELRRAGQLSQKAQVLRDYCAAVSVGIVESRSVLDLNYLEDSQAETDMNVVMTGGGGLVEVQGTAEGEAFPRTRMDEMLDLAWGGVQQLVAMQKEIVELS